MNEFDPLVFPPQAGISQNTVMYLGIFHIFPLEIVGILEINKKVWRLVCHLSFSIVSLGFIQKSIILFHVFGNGVTDVVLSQGVLAVSYSNKSVKLYSFEHIVQRVCIPLSQKFGMIDMLSFLQFVENNAAMNVHKFSVTLSPCICVYVMNIVFVFST